MEEPINKQGKRKGHVVVKGGGGNIGGLVVWGGVFVVGSLMAAFAVKKRRQGSSCDQKNCDRKGGSKKGVSSVLQTKSAISHLNTCETIKESTNVVKSEVDLYAKDLIMDQNPTPIIDGVTQDHSDDHQNIEDLAKGSILSSVECGCGDAYDFSFPVLDASLMSTVGNGIKQNSGEFFMNSTGGSEEEKIVGDVKIIALGMSKVHTVDAANDYMTRNESGKLEKVVDAEKITSANTPVNHSDVEMEEVVDTGIVTSSTKSDDSEEEKMEVEKEAAVDAERTIVKNIPPGQNHMADDMENSGENLSPAENIQVMKDGEMVDTSYAVAKNSSSLIATSSTKSDDSEEKMKFEKEAAVDAERTIPKNIPPGQNHLADDMEKSGENLALAENIQVMKDGEMVDTSYAAAKISSSLNHVGEGNYSRDGSPSEEKTEAKNGRDLANDEKVIAETASSMLSVGVSVDQEEEVEVKADPVEDLQLMENDASKHEVSTASSFEEEDKSDGYNEDENRHESYTSDGGEDSSEGTETSSAESHSEKIWSVESLDTDLKDSAEKIVHKGQSVINSVSLEDRKNSNLRVSKEYLQNWTKKKEESMLVENRRAHLTKWRSWGLSIPALLLLLLLLFALHMALVSDLLSRSFFVPTSPEN